jgi:hypothetical protein
MARASSSALKYVDVDEYDVDEYVVATPKSLH